MQSAQQEANNKTPANSTVSSATAVTNSKGNVTSQPQDDAEDRHCNVQSAPLPYHTRVDCSFSQVHIVDNLVGFREWLQEGLSIKVDLQKATYSKDQLQVVSISRPSSKKDKPGEKVTN